MDAETQFYHERYHTHRFIFIPISDGSFAVGKPWPEDVFVCHVQEQDLAQFIRDNYRLPPEEPRKKIASVDVDLDDLLKGL